MQSRQFAWHAKARLGRLRQGRQRQCQWRNNERDYRYIEHALQLFIIAMSAPLAVRSAVQAVARSAIARPRLATAGRAFSAAAVRSKAVSGSADFANLRVRVYWKAFYAPSNNSHSMLNAMTLESSMHPSSIPQK